MSRATPRRRAAEAVTTPIEITIAPLFGSVTTTRVPADSTVASVLSGLGYPASAEVRCNGEGVLEADQIVEAGDVLTIVSETKVKDGFA